MNLINTKANKLRHCKLSLVQALLGMCILLGCSACAPIIEPTLIKEGDAIELPSLIGTWKSVRHFHGKPHETYWTFTNSDKRQTLVNAVYNDPSSDAKDYLSVTASFTKLEDNKLYAEYEGKWGEINNKGDRETTIPLRSIAQIRIINGEVVITPLNLAPNLLKARLLYEKVSFKEINGRIHINCSDDVLIKFVLKYSHQLFQNNEEFQYRLRKIDTKTEFKQQD